MKLQGKVAIVTGGAMGIGRAIAEGLASEGASIVIADLANADQAAAEIRQKGTKAIGVKADVSSEADTTAMAQAALDAFDRIDILINNAGIFTTLKLKPFEEISVAEWRKVMDVNVMGIFLSCRAVAGSMKAQKEGRIINLASGVPFKGPPFMLHYVTSKGGVVAMTRSLARELGPHNILVNAVAPGFVISDGVRNNPDTLEKLSEISINARTLKREELPEDVVGVIKFLVGPDAAFITGQTYHVNGGDYFS